MQEIHSALMDDRAQAVIAALYQVSNARVTTPAVPYQ